MEDELRAAVRGGGSTVVFDLEGAVTGSAGVVLETAHSAACQQAARHVILDFSRVDYVNSAGIAMLIGLMSRIRGAEQRLALIGLNPHYRKIFLMMGMSHFAPVFDSESEAIDALGSKE